MGFIIFLVIGVALYYFFGRTINAQKTGNTPTVLGEQKHRGAMGENFPFPNFPLDSRDYTYPEPVESIDRVPVDETVSEIDTIPLSTPAVDTAAGAYAYSAYQPLVSELDVARPESELKSQFALPVDDIAVPAPLRRRATWHKVLTSRSEMRRAMLYTEILKPKF